MPYGHYNDTKDLTASGIPDFDWNQCRGEWNSIALKLYNPHTTGGPRAWSTHYRGALSNAMGRSSSWRMVCHPRLSDHCAAVHCNGGANTWMNAVLGGTSCLLPRPSHALRSLTASLMIGVHPFRPAHPLVLNTPCERAAGSAPLFAVVRSPLPQAPPAPQLQPLQDRPIGLQTSRRSTADRT